MKTLLLITHLAITPPDSLQQVRTDTVQVVRTTDCETELKREKRRRKTHEIMLVVLHIVTVAAICIPRKF